MSGVRPMLAYSEPVKPADLIIPEEGVWLSPKLDGVRCLAWAGQAVSRKLKPFPNEFVQYQFQIPELHGLDGELIVGSPTHERAIHNTTSGVMSIEGQPDFTFYVFDQWHTPERGFRERYIAIKRRVAALRERKFPVVLVPQTICTTVEEVQEAVDSYYEAGFEGAIVRSYNSPYKYNRSTLREGYMLKMKESVDSEIEVREFVEMRHNDNAATVDALGLTKRSTHQANKRGAGTLGKMIGPDIHTGEIVTIGTGKMTAEEKLHVWTHRTLYKGRIAKYRYAAHGIKDLPRHPRFIVWRDPIDL